MSYTQMGCLVITDPLRAFSATKVKSTISNQPFYINGSLRQFTIGILPTQTFPTLSILDISLNITATSPPIMPTCQLRQHTSLKWHIYVWYCKNCIKCN